jgi:uncharacterized protein YegP (UPF0339 family)
MMNKKLLFSMLLLFVGISMQAQSIAAEQMDERFNDNKLPYGWFAKDWKVDSTGVVKKAKTKEETAENDSTENQMPSFDIDELLGGGGSSYNYLMTPPLSVQGGEVLVFSARKGEADGLSAFLGGGGDEDSTFVVERSNYGEHKWIKVADFTTELDSVFKTFTISNTAAGEYRFRFRAGGHVEIDSVVGFHVDMEAPDIYPVYQKKNIQPIDLGVCKQDTTMNFSIINTATGTLTVDLTTSDQKAYTLDNSQVSIAAADTAKVNLTFSYSQAHEGRNSTLLTFKTTDERVEEIPLSIDAIIAQSGVWTEDFNNYRLPEGWFTEGWRVDSTGVATLKQGGGSDIMSMLGGGSSAVYYLMTPPLTVSDVNDVMLFSVRKPGGGGMDLSSMIGGSSSSSSSFIIEKSVYGSGKWEKAKDFTNTLDTVYTTQWLSNLEPGEYRFRFVASDSIVIDSVAGFQIDMNAPDLYVTLDSAVVKRIDFGMLRGDTTTTFTVINTGTGTLGVNLASKDETRLAIQEKSLSVAAGDSVFVDAVMLRDDERQGEIHELLMFIPADERISPQAVAMSAYIIPSDAWAEDFEYIYVIEDQTYPRLFPEGWSTTGWMLTQGGDDDMMAMFGGGGSDAEQSWVAKTDSKDYELITPRLQAKKGHLLRFTANIGGGMMAMFSTFMGGGGSPSYLNLYYKRDNDKDWTLYNTYFQSDTIVFKAPYSGFYRLKFMGEGVSLDDFYGFSLPKDSIQIKDGEKPELAKVDGQTWNVVYDRRISTRDIGDGTMVPVAATVCLPYEFNIDDYYEPGKAKLYRMEYVDTIYNQFIFIEMPDNLMEAGKPYMIVVNQGEIQFNAIDATMTSQVAEGTPVYDFTNWYYEFQRKEVGTWNGTFDYITGSGDEFALQYYGVWERLTSSSWVNPFRGYLLANKGTEWNYFRQNPDHYVNEQPNATSLAKGIVTRFYQQDGDGNGDVTEIPGLYYLGDINGSETNGIVAPTIHTIDRNGTHNYYDLQGRRLNGKPNKGIYIENGKKHVAR